MNWVESNWEDSEQGLSVAKRQLMAGALCSQWQPGGKAVQPPLLDPDLQDTAAPRNHAELAQLLSKRVTGSFRNFPCPHILRLHCTAKYLRPPQSLGLLLWATHSWLRRSCLGSFRASHPQWWSSALVLGSPTSPPCAPVPVLWLCQHICSAHRDMQEPRAGQEPSEWGVSVSPGPWSCLSAVCQILGLRWLESSAFTMWSGRRDSLSL